MAPSEEESTAPKQEVITIAQAIKLAREAGENGTSEMYLVTGRIDEVSNAQYGAMTIKDETGELFVYGVYGKDQKTPYSEFDEKPVAGPLPCIQYILSWVVRTPFPKFFIPDTVSA